MHELQQILLQKLPRLGELTFGCEVKTYGVKGVATIVKKHEDNYTIIWYDNYVVGTSRRAASDFEILGHPFTHADILEALGEDYGMMGDYTLMKIWYGDTVTDVKFHPVTIDSPGCHKIVKLPKDLHDLDKPEYKDTAERLISLIK